MEQATASELLNRIANPINNEDFQEAWKTALHLLQSEGDEPQGRTDHFWRTKTGNGVAHFGNIGCSTLARIKNPVRVSGDFTVRYDAEFHSASITNQNESTNELLCQWCFNRWSEGGSVS